MSVALQWLQIDVLEEQLDDMKQVLDLDPLIKVAIAEN